ncbi:hypothetical protein SDC9_09917 [bioreactor metagenome]|uniref:Uncharacterized protein n=1 Tax=bioreactor metagenome TaxID=1076179 RepID=A0A644TBE1_9ZZZZ
MKHNSFKRSPVQYNLIIGGVTETFQALKDRYKPWIKVMDNNKARVPPGGRPVLIGKAGFGLVFNKFIPGNIADGTFFGDVFFDVAADGTEIIEYLFR